MTRTDIMMELLRKQNIEKLEVISELNCVSILVDLKFWDELKNSPVDKLNLFYLKKMSKFLDDAMYSIHVKPEKGFNIKIKNFGVMSIEEIKIFDSDDDDLI